MELIFQCPVHFVRTQGGEQCSRHLKETRWNAHAAGGGAS
uniref:Uncharacterized protein n=1 Tax=Arundo donax TaxID=35708 RepID=A0A0A8ZQK8_ARUDO